MKGTSDAEEVFRAIGAIRAEIVRLRQFEREYLKLREENENLRAKVEQENARSLAVRVEPFRFSLGVDRFTGYVASNLDEFLDVLKSVPSQSLEFHLYRGDFEAWLKFTGSEELATVFGAVRNENLSGEVLRNRLLDAIQSPPHQKERQEASEGQ
ncbi:DUF5752 family protein [Candidatus Bathyarchaeota archaeon]|nr:DUF5752 family protein [Candidatus Bathyarchaeota archaeon]